MDIRYKDILMKKDKRAEYDTYFSKLSRQYANKKTSVKTNKYYNIDAEFNNFNSLVRDKIKLLRGFRDSLLYEETIEEQDSQRYEKEKAEFLEINAKLERFKSLRDNFYKDTEQSVSDIKDQLVDLRKELRILFLTFKSKGQGSAEWIDDINNYLKKKQQIDNLNKNLQKNIEMFSYPKYYLKTSIQASTAPSTATTKAPITYILKKRRRKRSKHKKHKKREKVGDTKGLKSKHKVPTTTTVSEATVATEATGETLK